MSQNGMIGHGIPNPTPLTHGTRFNSLVARREATAAGYLDDLEPTAFLRACPFTSNQVETAGAVALPSISFIDAAPDALVFGMRDGISIGWLARSIGMPVVLDSG